MILTIVSATPFEIAPTIAYLNEHFEHKEGNTYKKNDLQVDILVTGVGMTYTAFWLGKYFSTQKPDLIINAGIAGAFNKKLEKGDVINVIEEQFADLGVEEANGSFTNVHELALIEKDAFPFKNGILHNEEVAEFNFLPRAKGITVNKVHGAGSSIKNIKSFYDADVESMEGAAFFLACLIEKVRFLEIRSISNYVEPRNKENWDIPLAIEQLNKVLKEIISSFLL